jgi:hypothetical protein
LAVIFAFIGFAQKPLEEEAPTAVTT